MSVIDSPVKEIELDIDVFLMKHLILKSIIEAKEIIKRLEEENRWVRGEFEEDKWEVNTLLYNERSNYYDFSLFDSFQFNHKLPSDFKEIVKCWFINIIDNKNRKVDF